MNPLTKLPLRALRALLRVPPVRRAARSLHQALTAQGVLDAYPAELTPIAVQMQAPVATMAVSGSARDRFLVDDKRAVPAPRLNLLLPAISTRHLFGGASTALALLRALHRGEQQRILVTDENELSGIDAQRFEGWQVARSADAAAAGPATLVPLADRSGWPLPVHANDRFIATAWWTAHLARDLVRWQQQAFGLAAAAPFIYLIQDYEPGFYPWSTRFALAEQTYALGAQAIAVYNTAGLQRYVSARHPPFAREFSFEPSLSAELAALLPAPHAPRQRTLLVYGRPGVARNGFSLIVEGLRQWAQRDPAAARWTVLSLGEQHPPVVLGYPPQARAPLVMTSLGKCTLPDYARLMTEAAIGISLMLSPHPSYPPLEMAAFGMRVLTNRFEGKALSEQHPNIHDLSEISPAAIAQALGALVLRFDQTPAGAWSDPPGAFARATPPFGFADELRHAWLAGCKPC